MTKDEKIVFYNKIEKALKFEYPVIEKGLTKTEIITFLNGRDCGDEIERCKDELREFINKLDEPVTVAYLESELLGTIVIRYFRKGDNTEAFPILTDDNVRTEAINNKVTIKFAYLGNTDYTVIFPRPIYEVVESTDGSYVRVDKNTISLDIQNMEPKEININWKNVEED